MPRAPWCALVPIATLITLTSARPASAHPAPFSYVDVRLTTSRLDVTIVSHVYDVAHDLGIPSADALIPGKTPPLIDTNNGGSGVAYPQTLAQAASGITGAESVITGHSTLMTWADLQEYAAFNKDFLDWTEAQMTAGKSIDEAAGAYQLPTKYVGYTAQPARVKANITAIYAELKK